MDTFENQIGEFEIRPMLEGSLLPDEQILWAGQPDASRLFSKSDIFMIPFSLMWGGFSIFWEYMVIRGTRGMENGGSAGGGDIFGIIFPLFGLPFVLIGLYFIFGRFFYKSYNKKRTYYVLTNKRAIIFQGKNASKLRAVKLEVLPCIQKDVDSSGFGTVIFGDKSPMSAWSGDTGMELVSRQYGDPTMAFFGIRNADSVYDMANRLIYEKKL